VAGPGRVLVAPDSFKGTFDAVSVAEAMAAGLEAGGWSAERLPLADGGEGTARALARVRGGRFTTVRASGPRGEEVDAEFAVLAGGPTAVLDAAAASGLTLLPPERLEPEKASTRGTGELIVAAARSGATRVLVGVGGTASTDGGAGAIDAIEEAGGLSGIELTCLCDVRIPFELAAPTFAPQKGATPAAVERLREGLERFAESLPRDPRGVRMTGAGGGLSGGLWARYGARLEPGAAFVCDSLGVQERLAGARLVLSGEGRLDATSFEGKLVGEVAQRASRASVPMGIVVGSMAWRGDPLSRGILAIEEASSLPEITVAAQRIGAGLGGS
jgi:glycerate 2-kinase